MIDLLVCLIVSLFLSLIASPFVCLQDSFVSLIDLISCFFVCLLASSFLCLLLSLNVCKHVCLPNYLCVCAYSWLQLRLLAFYSTSLRACFSVYLAVYNFAYNVGMQGRTSARMPVLLAACPTTAASLIPPAKHTHTFIFIEACATTAGGITNSTSQTNPYFHFY